MAYTIKKEDMLIWMTRKEKQRSGVKPQWQPNTEETKALVKRRNQLALGKQFEKDTEESF